MNDKILMLTVGLPRSGKSLWAVKSGCPVVNPDSVRLALHGQAFVPEAEPMVWTVSLYMVRALFKAGHREVIVDATNTTRKRRDFWKSNEWVRRYAAFKADKAECIRRCKCGITTREDLIPIIERMAESYEPLEEDEWDE
jgi:predicted kinase